MQSSETEFASIFESGKNLDLLELSDANLRTDDGCNFAIHRVILARSSDYFRRMFVGMGKRRRKFLIPGISGGCLSDILRYIYTDDIQLTDRNITDLIIGADYLLLEDLQIKIKDYIKANLTEVNCLNILQVAHHIGDEYIFRKCFRFIQTRFEGMMQRHVDELADFPLELLGRILRNRSLYVYNETAVWQAIVAWTQKDIPLRMSCVPQLLLTLAMEDIEEQLATEILQHAIISDNHFVKDLIEITSSNDSITNLDVLLTFLRSYSNRFREPTLLHRIPLQLLFVWFESNLYITYDENVDLCRKITAMDLHPVEIPVDLHPLNLHTIFVNLRPDFLIAIGHNIYIFEKRSKICMNFDLRTMDWVRMESFRNDYSGTHFCVLAIDSHIYVLGVTGDFQTHEVEVYDTTNDSWSNGVPLLDIAFVSAVVIEKKIYVVGISIRDRDSMMTQVFDPDTQQWSILTPPTLLSISFDLVAYHQKIYLIVLPIESPDRRLVEVFDPTTNLWKELPPIWTLSNLKYYYKWTATAIVFNDQLIVSGKDGHGPYVQWNNAKECWDEYNGNVNFEGLLSEYCRFCTVDDVETIKMITKQNRDPETQMENEILLKKILPEI